MHPHKEHTRKAHLSFLWSEGIWGRWITFVMFIYGFVAAYKTEFLSTPEQEKWQAIKLIGPALSISLAWWLALVFLGLVFWVFEASFRLQRKSLGVQISLRNDILALRNNRANLRIGDPRGYQYQQFLNYNWRINVANEGPASANNLQVSLWNIAPPPTDSTWLGQYPYPLIRSGLTLDSPINPTNAHESQDFELFFSSQDHRGRFLLLDTKSFSQNHTLLETCEKFELTYKVTSSNSDPLMFVLEVSNEPAALLVKRKS